MAAQETDLAARPESMSKTDAKRLTAQIRRQLGDVQQRSERLAEMVRRAHRENAWAALGYATWDQWLAAEFPDLTRGQKYRLVAWGEVVGELEAAAQTPVEVSGRQAAKAKKAGTSAVADRVRQKLAGIPEPTDEDRRGAVADALAEPIEATGTKVEPPRLTPAPVPPLDPPEQEPAARARATGQSRVTTTFNDQSTFSAPPASAVEVTAGSLVTQLRTIEPATAAESLQAEDLDALMSWVGLVRAAIRRRSAAAKPTAAAKPAPAPPKAAPPVKTAPTPAPVAVRAPAHERAGVDVKPADCVHPANRIMGGTCFACGAKVGK